MTSIAASTGNDAADAVVGSAGRGVRRAQPVVAATTINRPTLQVPT